MNVSHLGVTGSRSRRGKICWQRRDNRRRSHRPSSLLFYLVCTTLTVLITDDNDYFTLERALAQVLHCAINNLFCVFLLHA